MNLRPEDINEILQVFADSELEELNLEIGDTRLRISKHAGSLPPATPPQPRPPAATPAPPLATQVAATTGPATEAAAPREAPVAADFPANGLVELRSPLLGVFYGRPSPDQPPFVEVGAEVEADDDVCIVDVMKMFTRVQAGTAGTIVEICAADGKLVEHGQVLMRIQPR